MDMHSNIRDLHEHREDIETSSRERPARGETRTKATASKVETAAACGSGWYHDAAIEAANRAAIEASCHPVHW